MSKRVNILAISRNEGLLVEGNIEDLSFTAVNFQYRYDNSLDKVMITDKNVMVVCVDKGVLYTPPPPIDADPRDNTTGPEAYRDR